MAKGNFQELSKLEQSLINYLVQKKEVMNNVPGGLQRVRSLALGMNAKNPTGPIYTVQIGMCEVGFSIDTGLKEKGSLFGIERYIMEWYRRPEVLKEMQQIAKQAKKE